MVLTSGVPDRRQVGCELRATVGEPTSIVLAVAVARASGLSISESLSVEVDGHPLAVREQVGRTGTRWHCAEAPAGELVVQYDAVATGRATTVPVAAQDLIEDVRPSRYVQSDLVPGGLLTTATVRALGARAPRDRLTAARDLVRELLDYAPGSTQPTDGLPEVLAAGKGVCRDFAHLLAGLLRATDVPARVVSTYAPDLEPMDFHAVVEVAIDGQWWVLDATGLAPRTGLLRIATGRDAADTAFLANDGSALILHGMSVRASADRALVELPDELVSLG